MSVGRSACKMAGLLDGRYDRWLVSNEFQRKHKYLTRMLCIESNASKTMHILQSIEYNALNTMHIIQCIEYNAYNTMHRIQYIEYFIQHNSMHHAFK